MRFSLRIIGVIVLAALMLLSGPVAVSQELEAQRSAAQNELLDVEESWLSALKALDQKKYNLAADRLAELQNKRIRYGFKTFNEYSLELLDRAALLLRNGDRDTAGYLVRKALELSPFSPQIIFKSLRLVHLTGSGSLSRQVYRGIKAIFNDRHVLSLIALHYIYPGLLAFTFGVFIAYVVVFSVNVDSLLRGVARLIPAGVRGVYAPLAAALAVIVPALFGPLWAVLIWGVVLFKTIPSRKILIALSAVCLSAWAFFIPVRERLALRMADVGVQTVLRVSSGVFSPDDIRYLAAAVSARPKDAAAWFSYGQVLLRSNDYEQAEAALAKADVLWQGHQAVAKAELAKLAFLRGDSKKADLLYNEAQNLGLRSAAFFYNYSKVKFDLMDTEVSRQLIDRAYKLNKDLALELEASEASLGLRNANSMANFALPWFPLITSLMSDSPGAKSRESQMMFLIMPWSSLTLCYLLALLLFILFISATSKAYKLRRSSTLYSDYQPTAFVRAIVIVLPGAAWVAKGHNLKGTLLLALSIGFILPFLNWPASSGIVLDYLPDLIPVYASLAALLLFAVIYTGYLMYEEELS